MNYQIFREFDAYEDAIQHAPVRMILHRRERPKWAVGQMSLGEMNLQWGTSGGGMITEGEILPGGYGLFIPLNNWSTNGVNGTRLKEGSIMVAGAGAEFCISADGWNDWLTLFVPSGNLDEGAAGIGEGITPACRVVQLGNQRLRAFRRRIRELIKSSAGDVQHPTVAVAESELNQLAKSAIIHASFDEDLGRGRPMVDRQSVVRGVMEALASGAKSEKLALVKDLASAAKVSERTLQRAFHDWFGVSVARYVRLQQLLSVRDALLAANPDSTTVTDVCVQHDINQFGRFAGAYRSLFGELPSLTLGRSKVGGSAGSACTPSRERESDPIGPSIDLGPRRPRA